MNTARECTLLELVQSVSSVAETDEEVVATVIYLINSGRVRLCGNFAGAKIALPSSINTFLDWIRPKPSLSSQPAPAV
jgi:hypothetical protein